jgi:hypothetical protein
MPDRNPTKMIFKIFVSTSIGDNTEATETFKFVDQNCLSYSMAKIIYKNWQTFCLPYIARTVLYTYKFTFGVKIPTCLSAKGRNGTCDTQYTVLVINFSLCAK